MYTSDPFDIPSPQQPRPEVPDHIRAFWSQVPDMRSTVKPERPATHNVCRFDVSARRVYHVRGCPHFAAE